MFKNRKKEEGSMGFADIFKNKYEKKLDEVIEEMQMNMSNNYKDNAQKNLFDSGVCTSARDHVFAPSDHYQE